MGRRLILVLALTGIGGVLLLIAAHRFGAPQLTGPGLLLFGVGVFAAGMAAITQRYTLHRIEATHRATIFEGGAAVLIGLALLVFAIGLAVAGFGFMLGAEDRLLALLGRRPGSALIAAGCAIASFGGSRVLGARSWRGSAGRFLASVPARIGGFVLVVVGLGLMAAGVLEVAAPTVFDELAEPILVPFRD